MRLAIKKLGENDQEEGQNYEDNRQTFDNTPPDSLFMD